MEDNWQTAAAMGAIVIAALIIQQVCIARERARQRRRRREEALAYTQFAWWPPERAEAEREAILAALAEEENRLN